MWWKLLMKSVTNSEAAFSYLKNMQQATIREEKLCFCFLVLVVVVLRSDHFSVSVTRYTHHHYHHHTNCSTDLYCLYHLRICNEYVSEPFFFFSNRKWCVCTRCHHHLSHCWSIEVHIHDWIWSWNTEHQGVIFSLQPVGRVGKAVGGRIIFSIFLFVHLFWNLAIC